jgi:hypothetical protein
MSSRRTGPFAVAAVFGGGGAWLFWEALFGGATFSRGDLGVLHRPMKLLVETLVSSSDGLPLWNPFLGAGQPFAANPTAELFHPMTALFLALPFEWAFRLQVILPVLFAVPSMYFMVRSLGASPRAALLAGFSFGFGGYALSATSLLPTLFSLAVVPAYLGFCARLGRRLRRGDIGGAALFLGLVILAGEPSTLLGAFFLTPVAVYGGRAVSESWTISLSRVSLGVAGAVVLGCGIGAAVVVPGLRHASMTARAAGIPLEEASDWSLPPVRLGELLVPDLTGTGAGDARVDSFRRRLYPVRGYPFLYSLYPGLLVSALALGAWIGIPRSRLWALVALGGALLAMGHHGPVWEILRKTVPLAGGIRYPEKFVLLVVLPVTVCGALGFDHLARGGGRRLRQAAVSFVVLAASFATAAIPLRTAAGGFFSGRLLRGSLMAGVGAGACLAAPLHPLVLPLGFGLATVIDLIMAGRPMVPPSDPRIVSAPPTFLKPLVDSRPDGYLFHHASYHPRFAGIAGLASPPVPSQWGILTALDRDWDLTAPRWSHDANRFVSEVLRRFPEQAGIVLGRRGISSVLAFRPGLGTTASLPEGPIDRSLILSRLIRHHPLAFCADSVIRVDDGDAWVEAIGTLGERALSTVVVVGSVDGPVPSGVSPGRVTVRRLRAGRLALFVEAVGPEPSLVAVNQTWDPGWEARVDGLEAPVLKVDLSLQAVVVPPGGHTVDLVYRNVWVWVGLGVSVLSLGLAGALALCQCLVAPADDDTRASRASA